MFHFRDNLFFGRCKNGSVRILKFDAPPSEWPDADMAAGHVVFNVTIDEFSWASIVASVSGKGEAGGRYYEALHFHNEGSINH